VAGTDSVGVNAVEDEQDLTNYLILVDYVIGLPNSWMDQRAFFVACQDLSSIWVRSSCCCRVTWR
jgi:hypothetical protein